MPITIRRHGDGLYDVTASPPDAPTHWRSPAPLTVHEVFVRLTDLGCHTTDVSDALYAADPFWTRHEREGRQPGSV